MREQRRINEGYEYSGNLDDIRAIEDSIRATINYTEGVGTMRNKHPVQGEDFHSKVFNKYYEVYPDTAISWDMPMGTAIDLLWGDRTMIDMIFRYDYRDNMASVIIKNGNGAVKALEKAIPGFGEALERLNGNTPAG